MRPISLEFQAFGPYKDAEVINFEQLAQNGLFLISGETGSGKTMILDAMTFALYGRSSGSSRDELSQLRCNRCHPKTDTVVCLTFEAGGEIYKFERRLHPGTKNLTQKQSALKLNAEGVFEPLFENCKAKDMNAKAEELTGLNYDQFRQVIILPQGQFEKLLTSGSEEKEKILVSIFGAGLWQSIADNLYAAAKAETDRLTKIKDGVEARLAEDGCSTVEELQQRADELQTKMTADEAAFRAAGTEERLKELDQDRKLADRFKALHGAEARAAELEGRRGQIEAAEKALQQAAAAEGIRPFAEDLDKTRKAAEKASKAVQTAEQSCRQSAEALQKAEQALAAHLAKEPEKTAAAARSVLLASKRDVYRNIDSLREAAQQAAKESAKAEKEYQTRKKKAEKAAEQTAEAYQALTALTRAHSSLMAEYMSGISGILAKDLQDGEPCPVCGSTEHPRKAPLSGRAVSREDVEEANAQVEEANRAWDRADEARGALAKQAEEGQAALAQRKAEQSRAEQQYQGSLEGLEPGIEDLNALEQTIAELDRSVKVFDEQSAELEAAGQQARTLADRAEEARRGALESAKSAGDAQEQASAALADALAGSPFQTAQQAAEALMSAAQKDNANALIHSTRTELKLKKEEIAELSAGLAGREEPSEEEILRQIAETEEKRRTYDAARGADSAQLARLRAKQADLARDWLEYSSAIIEAEQDLRFARSMRGDTGVGLQRYVLGILFSSVISAANEMLAKVHGGRYRLFRTDDKIGSSNKRGLDLKVYDSYSEDPGGRSVATLSGGEKFLASLALSIGLSTVARSGGAGIEAMFIDEGFGSLDEDSIQDALDVLGAIQRSSGLVGIISHVQLLADNIPSKLCVIKQREGSTIKVITG